MITKTGRAPYEGKALKIDIKGISETGTFTGWGSTFGNQDHGGDTVMPGAFTKWIQLNGNRVRILFQHDPERPIGWATVVEMPEGLWVEGKIDLDDPKGIGKFAHHKMRTEEFAALSIGWSAYEGGVQKSKGGRELHQVELWEVSVVTFPMNPKAVITSVKTAGTKEMRDFDTILQSIQMYAQHGQMLDALYYALYDVMYDYESTSDEKVAKTEEIISQFAAKYPEWARAYYGMEKAAQQELTEAMPELKRTLSPQQRANCERGIKLLQGILTGETEPAAETIEIQPLFDLANEIKALSSIQQ